MAAAPPASTPRASARRTRRSKCITPPLGLRVGNVGTLHAARVRRCRARYRGVAGTVDGSSAAGRSRRPLPEIGMNRAVLALRDTMLQQLIRPVTQEAVEST